MFDLILRNESLSFLALLSVSFSHFAKYNYSIFIVKFHYFYFAFAKTAIHHNLHGIEHI